MRSRLLTGMGFLILIGFVLQGLFGIAAALLVSASAGLCYGILKKDLLFIKWSSIVLIVDVIAILIFYICLVNSGM